MREIKFRAWAKYENTIMPDFQLHPDFGLLLEDKRFITMQYTGLKDKNGKEIYEGDVMLASSHNPVKEKVFWNDTHACFGVEETSEGDYYPLARYASIHEVIGNIYENPELVEVTNEQQP